MLTLALDIWSFGHLDVPSPAHRIYYNIIIINKKKKSNFSIQFCNI